MCDQKFNFQKVSSVELFQKLQSLVQTERKITQLILECINEIEQRKLHLEKGYSSLFDFLTLAMGYSAASAQRRIDGARLLRQLPEVGEKLERGHLNLSQVSLLQKTIRTYQLETTKKVTLEQKKILLEKLEKHSTKNSELILAQELNLPLPTKYEKTQIHKDESQSLTLHFSKEEMVELEQVRNLKTSATGNLDYKNLILYLARRELKKYLSQNQSRKKSISAVTSASEVKMSSTVYRKVVRPGACCQYTDPKTHKVCGSRVFLQADHIKPRWAFHFEQDKANMNSPENLRVLCANHNKYRYEIGC